MGFDLSQQPRPEKYDFRILPCGCGCCHSHDLGACDDYTLGGNGRCVYCDHGSYCHIRDKERRFYNAPLGYGMRTPGVQIIGGIEYYKDRHGSLRRRYPKAKKTAITISRKDLKL